MISAVIVILYVFFCLIYVGLAFWYCLLGNYCIQSVISKIILWYQKRKSGDDFEEIGDKRISTQSNESINHILPIAHQTSNSRQQLGQVAPKEDTSIQVNHGGSCQEIPDDPRSRESKMESRQVPQEQEWIHRTNKINPQETDMQQMMKFEEMLTSLHKPEVNLSDLILQQRICQENGTRKLATSSGSKVNIGRAHLPAEDSNDFQCSSSEIAQEILLVEKQYLVDEKKSTGLDIGRKAAAGSSENRSSTLDCDDSVTSTSGTTSDETSSATDQSSKYGQNRSISIYCDTTNFFSIQKQKCSCQDLEIFSDKQSKTKCNRNQNEITGDFLDVCRKHDLHTDDSVKQNYINSIIKHEKQFKSIGLQGPDVRCSQSDEQATQSTNMRNTITEDIAVQPDSLAGHHVINKNRKGPNECSILQERRTEDVEQIHTPRQLDSADECQQTSQSFEPLFSPSVTTFTQDYEDDLRQNGRRKSFTIQLLPPQKKLLDIAILSQNLATERETRKVEVLTGQDLDLGESKQELGGKTEQNDQRADLKPTLKDKQMKNYGKVLADLLSSSKFKARRVANEVVFQDDESKIKTKDVAENNQRSNPTVDPSELTSATEIVLNRSDDGENEKVVESEVQDDIKRG